MARKPRENQPALFVVPEIPSVSREYAPPLEATEATESTTELPEEDVLVTPLKDGRFLVATLRHYGTTSAHVLYTRGQLQAFVRRARSALEGL